ncbi:MAG TPA: thioredoxin family protein [Kiritimatiellia bacterium]|nr:thioredoxin family protein [Kiritimatiellia bacterium]HPS09306.1 thioredoxin family protein [Kiritimatiellia bacterium]
MRTVRMALMTMAALWCVAWRAAAGSIPATPAGEPIVPGEWHLSLTKALAVAQETGIPVLGFWSNTGCSRCSEVIDLAVNTPEFTAWRQAKKLLLVTGEGKTGLPGELYDWVNDAAADDGNLSYPFIRIYWVQKDGTVRADYRFSGYPYRADAQTLIAQIERFVADFCYHGRTRFGFTATAEMEPGTLAAPLPLVRAFGSSGTLTNTLSYARTLEGGGVTNWSETLVWADGETNRNIFVKNEGHRVGGTVTVTLSAAGETDETRVVEMVGEAEINIHNPRYVGEPFSFGEWTMDLDAATNAVAQSVEEDARTMVFFTAMWCPYCAGFEDDVLQTEAFKEFARTNKLALAVISIPSRDGMFAGSPMTHALFTNKLNAADRRAGLNGTSYMTRHGITPEAGWAQVEKILAFERLLTLPDKTFVNLPAVVMLRKDGSIASRIPGYYCFNYRREGAVYPPFMRFSPACNLTRLHEQLAMTRDERVFDHEENNNYAVWTREMLGVQTPRDETLAANDEADFFQLDAVNGTEQRVTVTGPDPVAVSVSIRSNGVAVASAAGRLTDGVSVEATIAGVAAYQVCVLTNDAAFSFTNVASTLRAYRAETTVNLIARECAASVRVATLTNAAGVFGTTMAVQAGQLYRLVAEGAQLVLQPGAFEPVAGPPGVFQALDGGAVALALTADSPDGTFTWQIWNPGTVGFVQTAQSVSETAGEVVIAVERTGGASGVCVVRIAIDPLNTTATAGEDFEDLFAAGLFLSWADGETGTKSVVLPLTDDLGYEGNEAVALSLAVTEGGATPVEGRMHEVVTITENDLPAVGRLMFTEAGIFFAKTSPLTIIAPEGGQVLLGVTRVDGASTAVTGTVTATAGDVWPETLTWANNDREAAKGVVVALPTLAEYPRGVVTVTLTPKGAVGAVSGKRSVTVRLVAENAPFFASDEVAFVAQTAVAFAQKITVLQTEGGGIYMTRLSGSLPAGVAAAFDKTSGALKFSGVPRSAGVFTSVFQVSETRSGRWVAGGAVQVTITVAALGSVNAAATNAITLAEGAVLDSNVPARVAGTLTCSVSSSGRATVRYRMKKGSVAFSSPNWAACDGDGAVSAVIAKGAYGLAIQLTPAGELSAWVTDPDYAYPLTATLAAPVWSAANPATEYEGYYTVVLSPAAATGGLAPLGHSFMTVSLAPAAAKSGRVTYAGYLADGTPYSGSAVLQPMADGTAQMTVFAGNTKHTLAGVFIIAAQADENYRTYPSAVTVREGVAPYWSCGSGHEETSYDIALEAFGGFYSGADSLVDFYGQYEGTGPLRLAAADAVPTSACYGTATALPFVDLTVSESVLGVAAGAANPTGVTLQFKKATGIFRGSMRLPFAIPGRSFTVWSSFAGVLLPGWVGAECQTGCADNEGELPLKPFGMGSYWYRDKVPVEGVGFNTLMSFSAGYPLIIEKAAE